MCGGFAPRGATLRLWICTLRRYVALVDLCLVTLCCVCGFAPRDALLRLWICASLCSVAYVDLRLVTLCCACGFAPCDALLRMWIVPSRTALYRTYSFAPHSSAAHHMAALRRAARFSRPRRQPRFIHSVFHIVEFIHSVFHSLCATCPQRVHSRFCEHYSLYSVNSWSFSIFTCVNPSIYSAFSPCSGTFARIFTTPARFARSFTHTGLPSFHRISTA